MPRVKLHATRIAMMCMGCITLLASCSTPQIYQPAFEPLDVSLRGDQDTCPLDQLTRCAMPSPVHDWSHTNVKNNQATATLLEVGEDALAVRLHLIRSARNSIDLQTYIWANDETGRLVLDELLAAARRGVQVRIIADQLYSGTNPANLARLALAHRNLHVRLYNPLGGEAVSSLFDKVKGFIFNFAQALAGTVKTGVVVIDQDRRVRHLGQGILDHRAEFAIGD